MVPSTPARRAESAWEGVGVSAARGAARAWGRGAGACAWARSRGGRVSWRRFLPLVVHRLRAGQGPQSLAEKVATIASLPRWVHGDQDTAVLPCGQVTVLLS